MFDCIVDLKNDIIYITLTDHKFFYSHGKAQNYMSTKGWKLCFQWKDVSTSWEKLYDLKNCYPMQTANYATAQGIEHEP